MPPLPQPGSRPETRKSPWPLPHRLVDLWPFVITATGLWFLLFCVCGVIGLTGLGEPGIWLWTSLAGWVLGLMGMSIMWSQQSAAARRKKNQPE